MKFWHQPFRAGDDLYVGLGATKDERPLYRVDRIRNPTILSPVRDAVYPDVLRWMPFWQSIGADEHLTAKALKKRYGDLWPPADPPPIPSRLTQPRLRGATKPRPPLGVAPNPRPE